MSTATPIPSTVTCFKNGLSHLTFPINFRAGLSPIKIGPLTSNTVNGSVSVIPEDMNLKVYSITAENNLMLKVHYKLENQEQDGKANLSYISPGIKWSPNYLVKVNEEAKTLTVGGRATIVSSIQFMDDITLPQLSLVSGVPNIACTGEIDPFVSNGIQNKRRRSNDFAMQAMSSRQVYRQADVSRDGVGMDDSDDDFDEEKVGELYHFKIKNVPINFQKATSVPFMDDIMDIPYNSKYSIKLDNSKADNTVVPAKHHYEFLMKYAPPLPRGPVMIYLQMENGLIFSNQTQLRPDVNVFGLDTTTSNDVDARYTITSGEKAAQETIYDPNSKREKILYVTNKTAKIVVKNRKKEEVEVHLEITIHGTINLSTLTKDESIKSNIIEKPGNADANYDPLNVMTWDMKVGGNETKELGFQYSVKHWEIQPKVALPPN